VPEWPKEPIKKGETAKIHVTFNSAGKMGMQDKTVTITSNAKTNPVVLHIKGNIEAAAPAPAEAPKN
jgi:LEA14-like dessication related protein